MRIFGYLLLFSLLVIAYCDVQPTVNTTTPAINTTTPAVNTTTITTTTTTTTINPIQTTNPSSTTAKPYIPKNQAASKNKWIVHNSGDDCIMVEANITFKYANLNNESFVTPMNANVSGKCNLTTVQNLDVQWNNGNLTMKFMYDTKKDKYSVSEIRLVRNATVYNTMEDLFETKKNNSYVCRREQIITLRSTDRMQELQMNVTGIRLEGFRKGIGHNFSAEVNGCPESISNTSFIAVGVFLIIVFALLVLAYFFIYKK